MKITSVMYHYVRPVDQTSLRYLSLEDFEKQLIELPLRGITNVKQVEVLESNIVKYNDDGSFNASIISCN